MTKSSLVFFAVALGAQPGPWEIPEWRTQSKPAFPAHAWNMEDGAIHSIPTAPRVDISTVKNYRNFECEFEWRIAKGANSGVEQLAGVGKAVNALGEKGAGDRLAVFAGAAVPAAGGQEFGDGNHGADGDEERAAIGDGTQDGFEPGKQFPLQDVGELGELHGVDEKAIG